MDNFPLPTVQENLLTLLKTSIPLFVTMLALCAVIFLFLGILIGRILQKAAMRNLIKKEREDAIKRSRAVLGGEITEQLSPYFKDFPCSPADCRFLGSPVDFVAFPGSARGEPVKEIVFIEVKTGKSTLSAREKEVQKAIREGRVRYAEYRR